MTEHSDDYYVELFSKNPFWSTPTPNEDEKIRWTVIEKYFTEYIKKDNLQKRNNIKILDLGCGRGWLTNLLSNFGTTIGIEPVGGIVEYAKKLFPEIKFIQGTTGEKLGKSYNSYFDVVVSSEVIEHIENEKKKEFCLELKRLVRENGYIIITTPVKDVQEEIEEKEIAVDQPVEEWMSENEIYELFNNINLIPIQKTYTYFNPETNNHFVEQVPNSLKLYQIWLFKKIVEKEGKKISVVIPYFNKYKFVKETIESVRRQYYNNWELIIVDDASTEGQIENLITDLKDNRIRLIKHKTNRGLAASRNTGIKESQNDLILCIDADDLIDESYLQKCVDILENENEVACIYPDLKLFGEKNEIWNYYVKDLKSLTDEQWIPGSGTLFKKELWEKVNGYDESEKLKHGNEDWDFWLRVMCSNNYEIRHIEEPLYYYRQTDNSMVSSLKLKDWETREYIYVKNSEIFNKFSSGNKFLSKGYINSAKSNWMNSNSVEALYFSLKYYFYSPLQLDKLENIKNALKTGKVDQIASLLLKLLEDHDDSIWYVIGRILFDVVIENKEYFFELLQNMCNENIFQVKRIISELENKSNLHILAEKEYYNYKEKYLLSLKSDIKNIDFWTNLMMLAEINNDITTALEAAESLKLIINNEILDKEIIPRYKREIYE